MIVASSTQLRPTALAFLPEMSLTVLPQYEIPVSTLKPQKFLGIQALRIVAATLVVVTHSTFYCSERLAKGFPVWEVGTRGVDIFFVISGFVMILSSQSLLPLAHGWKIFAEKRITRIVPLYWLVTTLKVALLFLTAGLALHSTFTPVTAIRSYLFLPAKNLDGKLEPLVGVGWTLNFEMMFYFLFTLALFFRKNVFTFIGVVLALLAAGSFLRQPSWSPAAFYLNSIVLEFYLGMLLARVCMNKTYIPRRAVYVLLPIGFVLLLLPPFEWHVLPKVIVSGLPAALIVWCVASLEDIERFTPRFILYLGDASYSIYLIHPFVCPFPPTLLHRLHINLPWLAVFLSVVLGIAVGCLLHEFVEKPVTKRLQSYLKIRRQFVPVTG